MDETTLKIAIAAFVHDIGKFADKKALNLTEQYINDHAGRHLPFHDGRYCPEYPRGHGGSQTYEGKDK